MTSQIGSSRPWAEASAVAAARSDGRETVRSAILTYFGLIVIQERAFTKGSFPGPPGGRCAGPRTAVSIDRPNITGLGPRRKTSGSHRPVVPSDDPRRNAMAPSFDQRDGVF